MLLPQEHENLKGGPSVAPQRISQQGIQTHKAVKHLKWFKKGKHFSQTWVSFLPRSQSKPIADMRSGINMRMNSLRATLHVTDEEPWPNEEQQCPSMVTEISSETCCYLGKCSFSLVGPQPGLQWKQWNAAVYLILNRALTLGLKQYIP